ncbi:LEAF RUST 10 DISEASE-RESISTANCE LOCUS RECEPTOR-LIKE PROTEIN KINASE-like 1.2 [Mangifera indica]|uniref:LEAF RUST 10 DISEASE-RESISTANCE LOCUS RECEPTOR-LIKE PROTEIN KINASE-like 1.2 n=1 Tax=Mangifera indica TaxID=29780 RepID=UPI001CFB32F7|nr:LEAF RUST 10 DISEASE-RESISTANCE LOCUS RECEPTOR-LIKE PROTEIN KINASE-like 1.2 [Mangifera indica]
MKNQVSGFCVFILCILSATVLAEVDPFYEACVRHETCGDGQNISFPFYIRDKQRPYCGYPGFEVSCNSQGKPVLNLHNIDYIIHQIFYDKQFLRVSNAAVVSATNANTTSCIDPRIQNVSLPEDRFALLSNQTDLVLLYNCSTSLPGEFSKYKEGICEDNENKTVGEVLALVENDPNLENVSKEFCHGDRVMVPVDMYGGDGGGFGIAEVINKGFLLNWTASNCSVCEDSGGKCGFNLSTYHFRCFCPDRPHAQQCDPDYFTEKGNSELKLGLGLGIGVGVGSLLILVLTVTIWQRKIKKYTPTSFNSRDSSSDPSSKSELEVGGAYFGVPIFSYSELAKATNNFSHEKELGDGGFGTVYYAKLRDGREVAVKRLYENTYRRVEQFMNEVEILTRLHHKNLVPLYGCTSRHSQQGLLLVYEYVPNGTVADHLHGDLMKPGSLTWPIRMKIAIETASALAYLHASDIIHRDVKTNNILLDNNFCVKVADFGLSRLLPTDVTHVSTAPQGSPGYVDPEYHQCYQLTDRSDVYSFGVVLIELISSMPAVDINRHREEINLANLALTRIRKQAIEELVDPSLGYQSDEEVKRMTTSVAELAFLCLQQKKEMRPPMDVVLEELKRIDSGEWKLEHVKGEKENKDMQKNIQPPPSPPDCEDIALLKHIRVPSSPISVTAKWVGSNNTTPTVSS